MPSADRLMKPVVFMHPTSERAGVLFCFESRARVVITSNSTDTYGSYSSVSVSRTYIKILWTTNEKVKTAASSQRFCKAETRHSLWCQKSSVSVHRKRYSLQWEDFTKTLASTTMAGFSMSALLWTILSSSCAGVGFFPGPAISAKNKKKVKEVRKNKRWENNTCFFGLWRTQQPRTQRRIPESVMCSHEATCVKLEKAFT